jgi:hypothetical protein
MQSRRWSGEELVGAETALAIARLVHEQHYGHVALEQVEPVSVKDDGNCWIVAGSKPGDYDPKKKLDGPHQMRISKFDGQILSYSFVVTLPTPSGAPTACIGDSAQPKGGRPRGCE